MFNYIQYIRYINIHKTHTAPNSSTNLNKNNTVCSMFYVFIHNSTLLMYVKLLCNTCEIVKNAKERNVNLIEIHLRIY